MPLVKKGSKWEWWELQCEKYHAALEEIAKAARLHGIQFPAYHSFPVSRIGTDLDNPEYLAQLRTFLAIVGGNAFMQPVPPTSVAACLISPDHSVCYRFAPGNYSDSFDRAWTMQ